MHLKGQRARHNSVTEENESLNFVVMLKKGNKQHFKGKQSLALRICQIPGLSCSIRNWLLLQAVCYISSSLRKR